MKNPSLLEKRVESKMFLIINPEFKGGIRVCRMPFYFEKYSYLL